MVRVCARAPVRVDPAGGGTDAPPFSVEHGGCVVNFAVNRHVFATVERLPAGSGVLIYASDLHTGVFAESVDDLCGPRLEFLAAFLRRLVPANDSVLLTTASDVPAGSGLGGNGALGVAVVAALDRAYGRQRSAAEIAAVANDVERQDLGYPGGSQDSYGAALGDVHLHEYPRGGGIVSHRLELGEATRRALEHDSLLMFTGQAHVSASIHADIRTSYAEKNSPTLAAMTELREHAVALAAALERDDLEDYARRMTASCEALYRLHPSCASEGHVTLVSELGEAVRGWKTCGAGGGGFVLICAAPGRRRECIERAQARGTLVWPVTIDTTGVAAWPQPSREAAELNHVREWIVGGCVGQSPYEAR